MRSRYVNAPWVLLCMLVGLAGSPASLAPRAALARPALAAAPALSFATGMPDNRFVVGQPISIFVSLRNPAPVAHNYARSETLVDYFGNVTALLTDTVILAAGQTVNQTVQPPIQGSGYFELHLSLTDQATNAQTTGFIPFSVLRPRAQGLDTTSAFGTNGSLTQAYGGNPQAILDAAQAMAAAGVRYDREEFNWQVIEKKPGSGQFDFSRTDPAVIAAHNAGIQILGLVAYWGNLPQPDTTSSISGTTLINTVTGCSKGTACAYTPQGDALFAAYAAAVVDHYRPGGALAQQQGWTDGYGISDWEVWNEPSTIAFWRHDIDNYPQRFASLYVAASNAIRQHDAKASVMYDESGAAIDTAVAAAGAKSDTISVHSYSGGLDPDAAFTSPNLPRGGQGTAPADVGAIVAQGLPVWLTETGYATDGTVSPRQQAQYLVRSYADFLASGVRKYFWFKFHEDGRGGENTYGIVNMDGSPKPAYVAYATMARHLQGVQFAQSVHLGTAVRADLFAGPSGSTVALLWSTAENGSSTIPAGSLPPGIIVDDIMDNPAGSQSNGVVTAPLSGDPVFMTVPGTAPSALAPLLQHGQIAGINPVGVRPDQAPGLINGLPDLKVTISARTNVPISGTVTLNLPAGWVAPILSKRFSTLQPGQSQTISFRLNAEVNHVSDRIGATATTPSGLTNSGSTPVTPYALTYGHPQINGSLASWTNASEADLIDLRPDQVVGIPGWTPQNLSARVYTMWDEQYFYLAADVTDVHFDYAPIGYNMYKGDSIQYGWGMDPAAWNNDNGQNRFNVTAGLTRQGPANFQYNLLGPWTDMKQDIRNDPVTGHTIYTTAVPWTHLGGYAPKPGNQFVFDLIINQSENGARIGWIQFSPGIGIGFRPSQWPFWTIISSNPAAGLRLGGLQAPVQGALSFTLPTASAHLDVHNGGMIGLRLSINGTILDLGAAGSRPLARFGTTSVDISQYVHAGANTVLAAGVPAGRLASAVLSLYR